MLKIRKHIVALALMSSTLLTAVGSAEAQSWPYSNTAVVLINQSSTTRCFTLTTYGGWNFNDCLSPGDQRAYAIGESAELQYLDAPNRAWVIYPMKYYALP